MSPEHFAFLAEFLRRRSGLFLTPHQAASIENRLAPVARRFGFRDVDTLLRELRYAPTPLALAVTEAVTVNDSLFFRDPDVYQHLRTVTLPALVQTRSSEKRLRIWCAASAAGQEAYSVAMLIDDLNLVRKGWSIDLFATEINSDLVSRAEEGQYTEFEVQRGLPPERLSRHFSRVGKGWRVHSALRRMVTFRTFNLLDSFGWLHPIDLVLCRNVLIYFEQKAKADVVDRISDILAPDGSLLLGRSESIAGLSDRLGRVDGIAGLYSMRSRGTVLRFPSRLAIA